MTRYVARCESDSCRVLGGHLLYETLRECLPSVSEVEAQPRFSISSAPPVSNGPRVYDTRGTIQAPPVTSITLDCIPPQRAAL
jgi:hypothetical protein